MTQSQRVNVFYYTFNFEYTKMSCIYVLRFINCGTKDFKINEMFLENLSNEMNVTFIIIKKYYKVI